ncbi:MAG TPA: peroxide stress protein YaaA [Candidatus Nanopelagicales bacterium]|nr:peroxide stress protein YaaA [Candidatus Nanopelagicales bacterium]
MLVLLPPSEGKATPASGPSLDLASLSFPELTDTRERVLKSLVRLAGGRPAHARKVLGLTAGQDEERERDARLLAGPCAPAGRIYRGVLYDALDLATLPAAARRRAAASVVVSSALFGAVRLGDLIPAYRLSGTVRLPRLGPVTALWRRHLDPAMSSAARGGLVVDLRSSTYATMWSPGPEQVQRTVAVRVLHVRPDGTRAVVSHFNKATKGRLLRALLTDGGRIRDVDAFAAACESWGYVAELAGPRRPAAPHRLDLVVEQL